MKWAQKQRFIISKILLTTGLFFLFLAQGCSDLHNSATVIEVNPANDFVKEHNALKSMRNLGFEHLYSLEGGYNAWSDSELPLTKTKN